jgi:hypothetical protein
MILVSYGSTLAAVRQALAALVVDIRYDFLCIACKLRSIRTVLVGLILVIILIVFEGLGPAVDVLAA